MGDSPFLSFREADRSGAAGIPIRWPSRQTAEEILHAHHPKERPIAQSHSEGRGRVLYVGRKGASYARAKGMQGRRPIQRRKRNRPNLASPAASKASRVVGIAKVAVGKEVRRAAPPYPRI